MSKFKHFSLSERHFIEHSLNTALSFKAIGRALGRGCFSVSKEIRNHLVFKRSGCFGKAFNNCLLKRDCTLSRLYGDESCRLKFCRSCSSCFKFCPDYRKE